MSSRRPFADPDKVPNVQVFDRAGVVFGTAKYQHGRYIFTEPKEFQGRVVAPPFRASAHPATSKIAEHFREKCRSKVKIMM